MRAVGTFALDEASFDSVGLEVKQSRPSTITVDNGVISMGDIVWEAEGSALTLGGDVDVTGSTPALNLTLKGVAVLRVLAAFVPGVGFDGSANVDIGVGGTDGEPQLLRRHRSAGCRGRPPVAAHRHLGADRAHQVHGEPRRAAGAERLGERRRGGG